MSSWGTDVSVDIVVARNVDHGLCRVSMPKGYSDRDGPVNERMFTNFPSGQA